jgi:hypothetical protein
MGWKSLPEIDPGWKNVTLVLIGKDIGVTSIGTFRDRRNIGLSSKNTLLEFERLFSS